MLRRLSAFLTFSMLAALPFMPSDADTSINSATTQLTFAQFSTAATTNDVEIYKCPTDCVIHHVVMVRDTDFAGGSISSYTISVGKSGSVTKYQAATDVFTGVSNGATNSIINTGPGVEAAGTSIRAYATASHSLSTATAGKVTFKVYVSTL